MSIQSVAAMLLSDQRRCVVDHRGLAGPRQEIEAAERPMRGWRPRELAEQVGAAQADLVVAGATANGSAGAELQGRLSHIRWIIGMCEKGNRLAAEHEAACRGDVRIGMTAAQVRTTAWCQPDAVNTMETAGHRREQRVYDGRGDAARLGSRLPARSAISISMTAC
jgi:hypothetical protein